MTEGKVLRDAIAETLLMRPDVVDVAVESRPGASGSQLVAYLDLRRPFPPVADLASWLRARLGERVTVPEFVIGNPMPRRPDGTIDVARLVEQDAIRTTLNSLPLMRARSVEAALEGIWQSCLAVEEPIPPGADFFDLGGTSIKAVFMLREVAQVFRVTVPLADLMADPTIAGVALALRQEEGSELGPDPVLLDLNGRSGTPLVAVHPAHGTVIQYARLAQLCRQRVIGIQAAPSPPLEPALRPLRLADLALAYVRQLRRLVPHEPYLVMGYCTGALIAYEMCLLLAADRLRAHLILVDPSPIFGQPRSGAFDMARFLSEWYYPDIREHELAGKEPGEMLEHIVRRSGEGILRLVGNPSVVSLTDLRTLVNQGLAAAHHWSDDTFSGPSLTIFAGNAGGDRKSIATRGWRDRVLDLAAPILVGGRHESVLHDPCVQLVAQAIDDYVNRLD
jgi:thioesterase domain-containing protein